MEPPILLQRAGGRWYHSDDYHSPNLSKASLGSFMVSVLSAGGFIGQVWPFSPKYPRSSVYFTVFMTPEMKDKIEAETKFKFKNPPVITLNSMED